MGSRGIEWYNFRWPWVTSDPDFKVTTFLKSNIWKTAGIKDKVTIAQEESIPNIWNGTMFGDKTRRAGLSASAELLVHFANAFVATSSSHFTALSSASWRSINPWSVNFVRGHDSTMWIIVCRSPEADGFWCPGQDFQTVPPPLSDGPSDDGFQLTLSVSKFTYLINE